MVSMSREPAPTPRRLLPPWTDDRSDGCTCAPDFTWIWPGVVTACRRHDAAYYLGGSAAHRRVVDLIFYDELVAAGMWRWLAGSYYLAVRLRGAPYWGRLVAGLTGGRVSGRAWAFGGRHFRYDAQPALVVGRGHKGA